MNIKIGSVPYLNARPLIRWFSTDDGQRSGVDVIEETPSRLAAMLDAEELDAALVSVYASFDHPEYTILPGVSISGQGEIKSVRAFSRLPFGMLHSIAMDTSSLTSVALLKILLAEVYNSHPQAIAHAPNLDGMLRVADAALLIGDPGMLASDDGLRVLDLGEAWRKHVGLPFTYAVWLARPGADTEMLADILRGARDYGLSQAPEIASEEALRLGCSHEVCYEYVTEVMDYDLGDQHYEAITTFHKKCRENGLLSR
ncbi:MAG: menaquinone biosynthesis protein [Capsulimonadaceae bacterium]|nr:menaquinone biosynthesis protein [Capsulimonadaceae bacterium]